MLEVQQHASWGLAIEEDAVPSCTVGRLSLEHWASRWEVSWGFHAVRKPSPTGRPHENTPAGCPSLQVLLTQVSNMQVSKFPDDCSPQLSSQPQTLSLLSWGLRHGGGEAQISHPHSLLSKFLPLKHAKIAAALCHCVWSGLCYVAIGTRIIQINESYFLDVKTRVQLPILESTPINSFYHWQIP